MSDTRPHDIDSYDCWCRPQFFVPCDECDGDVGGSCWKCSPITFPDGGTVWGLVEIDRATAGISDVTLIISHRAL